MFRRLMERFKNWLLDKKVRGDHNKLVRAIKKNGEAYGRK